MVDHVCACCRWNWIVYCIERVLYNKIPLKATALWLGRYVEKSDTARKVVNILDSPDFWNRVNWTLSFLQPLADKLVRDVVHLRQGFISFVSAYIPTILHKLESSFHVYADAINAGVAAVRSSRPCDGRPRVHDNDRAADGNRHRGRLDQATPRRTHCHGFKHAFVARCSCADQLRCSW